MTIICTTVVHIAANHTGPTGRTDRGVATAAAAHPGRRGGRRRGGCAQHVIDEGAAPLALHLAEVAGMDHEQRLDTCTHRRFGLIRQLVLHTAVHVQRN